MRLPMAMAALLTAHIGVANAGVIIGNSGKDTLRPIQTRQGADLAVRLPIQSIRWQLRQHNGPALPAPAALRPPAGAVGIELLLDGNVEIETDGGLLVVEVSALTWRVPIEDPDAVGVLGWSASLPDWLRAEVDRAGTLTIGAEDPQHGAVLRAVEDGLLVR